MLAPRKFPLYACTIFLSAFLLFVIQPMAGKHVLPYFGGSSSVWATSLLFFTSMLFAGYVYVYLLTTFAPSKQVIVHGAIVACGVCVGLAAVFGQALFPSLAWTIGSANAPALDLIRALTLSIGIPYFLLSTTGPLLQYWWGLSSAKEPYRLYALSNAGSFLALISYPFFIEPALHLHSQEVLWSVLFVGYALILGVICAALFRTHSFEIPAKEAMPAVSIHSRLFWVSYATLPSLLLVATTTVITQTIAPVPLLWIVPLCLYLLSFILAFRGSGQSIYVPVFVLLAAYAVNWYWDAGSHYVFQALLSDLALLFFAALYCHGQLYRLRPPTSRLPLFYVFLSLGGMLGAFAGALLAPMVFNEFLEFPLGVAVAASLAVAGLAEPLFPRVLDLRKIFITKLICIAFITNMFFQIVVKPGDHTFIASRNFYGSVKVEFAGAGVYLLHGTTFHGMQPIAKELQYQPNSYYAEGSGIGRAIRFEEALRKKEGTRVGIVGLGTASIAAYCRPQDAFVFYEIDPRIEGIAKNYFSYLSHCAGSSVRLGDGRLVLARELQRGEQGNYDVVAIDAFADDTVPVHLLTLQAISLYEAHLRSPQSIIAVHTSNRYLDLPPVILKIAAQEHLTAKVVNDNETAVLGGLSQWVLLAKDPKVFDAPNFANSTFMIPNMRVVPLWTDDYTSLFTVVNLPSFR